VTEARTRGLRVTALVRDPERYQAPAGVRVIRGDVTSTADLERAAQGQDAVVAAVYDRHADPARFLPSAASALSAALGAADVARLVWVGLGPLLPDAAGVPGADTGAFPAEHRPFTRAHAAALDVLHAGDLDWAAVSPSGDFESTGRRLGGYRFAPGDFAARISYPDHAIALVDEAVEPTLHRAHAGVIGVAD